MYRDDVVPLPSQALHPLSRYVLTPVRYVGPDFKSIYITSHPVTGKEAWEKGMNELETMEG